MGALALLGVSWALLSDRSEPAHDPSNWSAAQSAPGTMAEFETQAPAAPPLAPSTSTGGPANSKLADAKRRYDEAFTHYTNLTLSPASASERESALRDYRESYALYLALKDAPEALSAEAVSDDLPSSDGATPESLLVLNYQPNTGAAGSQVLIELSSSIRVAELTAAFRDRPMQVRAIADRVVAVNIPVDLTTDEIRLAWRGKGIASLPFTVKAPQSVSLYDRQVAPSERPQTLKSPSGVSVTLPAGLLSSTRQVSISKLDNPAVEQQTPFSEMEVYDVSISGMTQLDDYIEIGIPFDPAKLDPRVPVEANFSPARWDETSKSWVDLYYRVDRNSNTLYFATDHLCSFWTGFSVLGLGKTAGVVVVAGGAIGEVAERWANDKYVSKNAKIRILYSDAALRKMFPDADWKRAIAPAALASSSSYNDQYAASVQDIAHIFEEALARYVKAGFPDPTVKGLFGIHVYTRYVKVKIDSLYNYHVQQGEMAHETFWDTIHVPSELIKLEFYDPALAKRGNYEEHFAAIKGHLAHELFHVVQRPHYPLSITFVETPHKWWREATAEWAGHDLAKIPARSGWEADPGLLVERIGTGFLANPINSTGRIAGTSSLVGGLDYEYLTSAFVRFLVGERKLKINELIAQVAKDQEADPLVPLRKILRGNSGQGFNDVFGDFSVWLLQQTQLPLSDFAGNSDNYVAQRSDTVKLAPGESRLRLEPTGASTTTSLKVHIFRAPKGRENLTAQDRALHVLDLAQPGYEIGVADGDTLYLVVGNGSERDETLGLAINARADGDWQRAATASLLVRANGSATVWAVRVGADKASASRLVADFSAETDPTSNPLDYLAIAIEKQGGLDLTQVGEGQVSIHIPAINGSLNNGYDTQGFQFSGVTLSGSFTPSRLDKHGNIGSVSGSFKASSDTVDQRGNSTGIGYVVEVTGTFVAGAPGRLSIRFSGNYRYDYDDPDILDGTATRSVGIRLKYP
jgi:hypothetical protein